MIGNKKGLSGGSVVLGVIVIIILVYIIFSFVSGSASKNDATLKEVFSGEGQDKLDMLTKSETDKSTVGFISKYIFGLREGVLENLNVENSNINNLSIRGAMIIIATWIIFLVIITSLIILVIGSKRKIIGILIGIVLTIILANLSLYYNIIAWLMGAFSFLAGVSVIAALLVIIILGIGAHFGASWVVRTLQRIRR